MEEFRSKSIIMLYFLIKFVYKVEEVMETIHKEMFKKAHDAFQKNIQEAGDWKTFMVHLNNANIVLTPWFFIYFIEFFNYWVIFRCLNEECEKKVKEESAIESKIDETEVLFYSL